VRIAKLQLLAFGPFTHGELGFSPRQGVLDLVYGPNEAGKSTTLRALTALLYGIPARTADGHVHEMARMRVGATLVDHAGRSLHIVRRKGQKQTLLDLDDEPVSEQVLASFLGGLDEAMFRQMFGLDHERLREGAEALLSGGGHVGESLFDAGTGARAIRSVLEALKLEADELFKPRGTTTKLQVAVKALRERQRERKEAMLSPQTFTDQRRAVAAAQSALAEGLSRRQELLRERSRLSRALAVLPLLARREVLLAERRQLGASALLPLDESEQRSGLEARLSAAHEKTARLASELEALNARLAELPAPRAGKLERELLRELEQRFGSYRKNAAELPQKQGELAVVNGDIAGLRQRLGSAVCALDRLDSPARTRLRALAEEDRLLAASERSLSDELAALGHARSERERQLGELGSVAEPASLAALLRRAEQDERAQSLPRLAQELARERTAIERALGQLGLPLTPDRLSGLSLPEESELERLEQRAAELAAECKRLEQRGVKLGEQQKQLADERALLFADGEVVTEARLGEARSERARAFAALLPSLRRGDGAEPALAAFQAAEQKADELADRLRREAGRAHKLRQLEHDEAALAELTSRFEVEQVAHAAHVERQRAEVDALLAPLGLATELRRARGKLQKLSALVERAGQLAERAAELEVLREHARGLGTALARAAGLPEAPVLAETLAAARGVLERDEARHKRHHELAAQLTAAREKHAALDDELGRTRAARRSFGERFGAELVALGFAAELGPAEVLAAVDDLTALQLKLQSAASLSAQLESLLRENAQLEADLAGLCREQVPEALGRPVAEAMARVAEAHQSAHDAARERERLESALGRLRGELREHEHGVKSLEQERSELFGEAGVTSFAALRERERRAKQAAELQRSLEELELSLATASEGLPPEELERQVRSIDPDEARARLVALESELEAAGEEVDQRNQEIGRLSAGLEQLRGESGAVSLAEEAEAELSSVRALARRYAELRLGHALLAREVERYRAAHQGPLLERAAVLFPRLTLERYRGLEVALDDKDQPVLTCVRSDDKRVRVDGLSDGTRDQLYLALRVASIERYLDKNPPMPLVLDDAFVHFDDARATAALGVLGELCQRTQVLFFTHHSRMLELAKKALGKEKVLVHELDPARGVVRTRDDGPLFARV
jgi:uncharacterized protein YhaN